jgi:hypothetical protein
MELPKEKTSTGDENLGLVGPDSFLYGTIPHHHGDLVRLLLLAAGAFIILAVPMVSVSITQTPFELLGAIILIVCASLTTPHRVFPFVVDAVVSAAGLVIYEPLAIRAYQAGELVLFVVYEALALIFVFALYFSVKTLRGLSVKQSLVLKRKSAQVRADGEEYVDPPVTLYRTNAEERRKDSRRGDMRDHGRYDD